MHFSKILQLGAVLALGAPAFAVGAGPIDEVGLEARDAAAQVMSEQPELVRRLEGGSKKPPIDRNDKSLPAYTRAAYGYNRSPQRTGATSRRTRKPYPQGTSYGWPSAGAGSPPRASSPNRDGKDSDSPAQMPGRPLKYYPKPENLDQD